MALALFIRYDWTFKHYVIELQAQGQIWTGPYILIVSSAIAIAMAFFGCWATAHENPYPLLVVRFEEKNMFTPPLHHFPNG